MVISRVFLWKFLKIHITSVSGCLCFTFKICQIVAGTSMIRRFHEFFESRFWRVFAILPNCVAWPGGTKHTKRRKCPLLGKSRVLPTHCRMCTAPRNAATAASGTNLCAAAALNLRAHRHFVPYRLCLLERSRVGRINLSTTTSTLLGWHGSRASVVVLWMITSATFYGEIANGLDSIWQAGR